MACAADPAAISRHDLRLQPAAHGQGARLLQDAAALFAQPLVYVRAQAGTFYGVVDLEQVHHVKNEQAAAPCLRHPDRLAQSLPGGRTAVHRHEDFPVCTRHQCPTPMM